MWTASYLGSLVQVEGQVLLMEALLAKVEELELPRKVLPNDILDLLPDRGFVDVAVDVSKLLDLV